MALVDAEGFGGTATLTDLTNSGVVLSINSNGTPALNTSGGPFGDNYISGGSNAAGGGFWRIFPAGYSSFIVGSRINVTQATGTGNIYFADSVGNEVFHISINGSTGALTVARVGTTLATVVNAFIPGTWNFIEISTTISTTVGAVTIRRNGTTILTLTGVNNQATTGNLVYAVLWNSTTATNMISFTHYYLCDTTGPAPYNTFLGDVRILNKQPLANSAVQFTPSSGNVTGTGLTAAITSSYATGTIVYSPVQLISGRGTLTALSISLSSTYTGHFKLALYSDSGQTVSLGGASSGPPVALLAQSAEITNGVAGVNTVPIVGGPFLTPGFYWVAVIADATLPVNANSSGTVVKYTQALSYASGFPSSANSLASAVTGGICTLTINANDNYVNAGQPSFNSGIYNSDTVAGHQDLFTQSGGVPSTATVYAAQVKTFALKPDAGVRSGANIIQSGTTTVAGSAFYPGVSVQKFGSLFTTDPATGVAWTPSGINAAKFGYRLVS